MVVCVDAELASLIPGFFENLRKDVRTMREALDRNDFEAIHVIGHRMGGAGGSYGFDAITGIGQSLELAAKNKDAEEIRRRSGELLSYLDRVHVVYG